jgi:hypothetical protein
MVNSSEFILIGISSEEIRLVPVKDAARTATENRQEPRLQPLRPTRRVRLRNSVSQPVINPALFSRRCDRFEPVTDLDAKARPIHPSEMNNLHEFYLMCDDIHKFVTRMKKRGVPCGRVRDQGYGLMAQLTLPGGGKLGVYEPRHARPKPFHPKGETARVERTKRQ